MSLHRQDLLDLFPNYEYWNPTEPWRIDYRRSNTIAPQQIQAFHYYWATRMGQNGHLGLSFFTPNLPHCLCVDSEYKSDVHCVLDPERNIEFFQQPRFALIVGSAAIPLLYCYSQYGPHAQQPCSGKEIIPILQEWAKVLFPGGILIAAIIDNTHSFQQGWDLQQKGGYRHVWTSAQFYDIILTKIDQTFEIVEFDTFHNHFAFNVVLKKRLPTLVDKNDAKSS